MVYYGSMSLQSMILGIVFLPFSYMDQWKIVWLMERLGYRSQIAIILLIQPNCLLRKHYPISYFFTPAP